MKMGAQRRLSSVVHQVLSPSLCAGAPADFDKKHVEATGFLLDETRELDMQKTAGKYVDATGFLLDTLGDLHLGTPPSAKPRTISPVVGAPWGTWEEGEWEEFDFTQEEEGKVMDQQQEGRNFSSGLLMGDEEAERRIMMSETQLNPGALVYAMNLNFESASSDTKAKRRSFEAFLRGSKLEEFSLMKFVGGGLELFSHRELRSGDGAWGEAMMAHTKTPEPQEVQLFIQEQQGLGVVAALHLQLLSNGDALVSPVQDLQQQAAGLAWMFLRVQQGAEIPEWWSSLLDLDRRSSSPVLIPTMQDEEKEEASSRAASTSFLEARPTAWVGFMGSDGIPILEDLECMYRHAEERKNATDEQEITPTIAPAVTESNEGKGDAVAIWAALLRHMDGVPSVEELQSLLRHVEQREVKGPILHEEETAATTGSPTTTLPVDALWCISHMDRVPTVEELQSLLCHHQAEEKEESARTKRNFFEPRRILGAAKRLLGAAGFWSTLVQENSASIPSCSDALLREVALIPHAPWEESTSALLLLSMMRKRKFATPKKPPTIATTWTVGTIGDAIEQEQQQLSQQQRIIRPKKPTATIGAVGTYRKPTLPTTTLGVHDAKRKVFFPKF